MKKRKPFGYTGQQLISKLLLLMKIITFLPLIIIFVIFFSCLKDKKVCKTYQSQEYFETGKIEINQKTIDFGVTGNDTTLTAIYKINNIGNKPVKILNLMPDCSCTDYRMNDTVIMEGDSSNISLIFKTKGRSGKQELLATLEADTYNRFHLLKLRCWIEE